MQCVSSGEFDVRRVERNEYLRAGRGGPPRIKFCGLTRPEDAAEAARLGAAYVGAIFAESPRRVDVETARVLFDAAGEKVAHVAVFGRAGIGEISPIVDLLDPDVIQLTPDSRAADIATLRNTFRGEIWGVVGLERDADSLPPEAYEIARVADAVLLDVTVGGRTGGSGIPLSWELLAAGVRPLRQRATLILAGGLRPENVARAIQALLPDVVDVSSGVESGPGVKDPALMSAFAQAVHSASIDRGESASSSSFETE